MDGANTDPVTLALTGMLPFIILLAAALTPVIALSLLRLYRRRVLSGMNRSSGVATAGERPLSAPPVRPRVALEVTVEEAATLPGVGAPPVYWRSLAVYGASGAVFALIMTLATLISAQIEITLVRSAYVFLVYVWPVLLAVYLDGAVSRRALVFGLAIYIVVMVLLSLYTLARSPDLTGVQLIVLWLIVNVPALALSFAFAARPLRAVGPMIVLFLTVLVTGPVVALAVVGQSDSLLQAFSHVGAGLGADATGMFIAILAIGLALFAPLGWLGLRAVRYGYVAKYLNDKMLTVDAVFLVFGIVQSIGLAFEGPLWVLAGPFAFVCYKVVQVAGLRLVITAGGGADEPVRLLILRVFSLGTRSRKLFERVTRDWRYRGPIQLIAGPDLVTTTVDPEEFLEFLAGRLESRFIRDESVLEQRIHDLDVAPDIDARYRVNEFFCYDDTWERALSRMVDETDVVLMDLRGFTPRNAGCIHEINELVNRVDLERFVLVIDSTTDTEFLRQILGDAWETVRADSPNAGVPRAQIRLVNLPDLRVSALRGLSAALMRASTPTESNRVDTT